MEKGINLSTFLQKYKEKNSLIYHYLEKKINTKENFEETMNKLNQKFKTLTPIKNRKQIFISKEKSTKKIRYQRPKYFVIDIFYKTQNSVYNFEKNNIFPNIKKIYYKTPIKDRCRYNIKGNLNYSSIKTNNTTIDINKTEFNAYNKINQKSIVNLNNTEILNERGIKNIKVKKLFDCDKINNYRKEEHQIKNENGKMNESKSYDNIIFKKKIKIIKKKKPKKIFRQKTYDFNKENNSKNNIKVKKNLKDRVDTLYKNKNIKNRNKRNINNNTKDIDKILLIQKWWKNINQKRIENFIEKFNLYRTNKKNKKSEKNSSYKDKRFSSRTEKINNSINISVVHKSLIKKCSFYYTKNNYTISTSRIILIQRKIREFLKKYKTIIKKIIILNSYISRTRINKINKKKNINFKIEYNFINEIAPTVTNNKDRFNTLLNIEKKELEIVNQFIKPKSDICYITKIKYELKIKRYRKGNKLKKLKDHNKNIIKNYFINISANENTILKFKRINRSNISEDKKQENLNIKSNNKKIYQKNYINWNDFILYLNQVIIKNVEQFIFYKIKNNGKCNYKKIIFFSLIKRIINIYNNLLNNEYNNIELFYIIKLINTNLSKNIEYFNKYNYISFIPKKAEDNLINTQIFPDDNYLLNFLLILIKLEHGNFAHINIKQILCELLMKYKLNSRNIYTIIRYADFLYEQMIKNENINESDNLDIKHAKILSFKSREKYFKNKNNNRKNILFSFSYIKHPNFHKKSISDENLLKLNESILLNNKTKNNNNKRIYFSITKINKIRNNSNNSGEIDIFKNIDKKRNIKIINRIYDDYCYDSIENINLFDDEEERNLEKEKIRHVSKLTNESELINEINCKEEDIVFNQIKECFN